MRRGAANGAVGLLYHRELVDTWIATVETLFGVKMLSKMLFFVGPVLSVVGTLTMAMGGLGACMMAATGVRSSLFGVPLKGQVGGALSRMRLLLVVLGFGRVKPAIVLGLMMGSMGFPRVGSTLFAR